MRPTILNPLFAPVVTLSGIGDKLAKLLSRFFRPSSPDGNEDALIVDLLFHTPSATIDRRKRYAIAELPPSGVVTIEVTIGTHHPPPPQRKNLPYRVDCFDDSGQITLVFFHAYKDHLLRSLPVGEKRMISGPVEWYRGLPQMPHPHHMLTREAFERLPLFEPVYPLTQGLTSRTLTKAITSAMSKLPDLPEWQEVNWLAKHPWPDFASALKRLHHPQTASDIAADGPLISRLAYDELLADQLALAMVRRHMKHLGKAPITVAGDLRKKITAGLPFELTGSQMTACEDILADLAGPHRMMRLLLGDVGSGKTVVALLALADVIESGAQGAFMAPTEILARQHFATLTKLTADTGLRLEILTGRDRGKPREQLLQRLKQGEIDILIGTHALFQNDVVFANLKLAIIDEQHRFGVQQRLALQQKADNDINLLVMTATPIPRTLTLTLYGDMDVSKLLEKPAGRLPVDTRTIPLNRLDEVIDGIERALSSGRQIYWICPLVEENPELRLTSVEDRFTALKARFGETVALVHGRMKPAEKDRVMTGFQTGHQRLLVATTVIEVGVDVPNASIMVIEHAENFGLAQLHQLRGRIGRGSEKSSCLLLYKEPLGETAHERLSILRRCEDGFVIAEEDLRLRGSGELLGTRQSGAQHFRLADLAAHGELLAAARDDVELILRQDPQLQSPRGEALRTLLYLFGREDAVKLLRAG